MFWNSSWWIIALVAILGSYFLRYQKMKMKELRRGTHQDMEDMQTMVHSLKKRIENLEAIASEPEPGEIKSLAPEVNQEKTTAQAGKMENMLNQK